LESGAWSDSLIEFEGANQPVDNGSADLQSEQLLVVRIHRQFAHMRP
jgi:hypothetical protein